MSEQKQLTTEELQKIKDLQKQYNQYIFEIGSIEAQIQSIQKTKEELEKEKTNVMGDIMKLSEMEKELIDNLHTKYGVGNIDPQTGLISPF